jgi:hypothetical protein
VISTLEQRVADNEATADHISFADISENAGAASNRLWTFLQGQYGTIREWIFENAPTPDTD